MYFLCVYEEGMAEKKTKTHKKPDFGTSYDWVREKGEAKVWQRREGFCDGISVSQ